MHVHCASTDVLHVYITVVIAHTGRRSLTSALPASSPRHVHIRASLIIILLLLVLA
jgi:hypothetical protein